MIRLRNGQKVVFSQEFEQHFSEIGENLIKSETYIFSGAYTPGQKYYWAEWLITFQKLSFEWNYHISHKDWLNGKRTKRKSITIVQLGFCHR